MCNYLLKRFIYLKVDYKGREKEREKSIICCFTPSNSRSASGLGQTKAKSGASSASPMWVAGAQGFVPSADAFSQAISRQLGGNWSSWDLNWFLYGIPVSQVATLPITLEFCSPKLPFHPHRCGSVPNEL